MFVSFWALPSIRRRTPRCARCAMWPLRLRPGANWSFTSSEPPTTLTSDEAALVAGQAERYKGEPWLSYFEPLEMERHLRDAGFRGIVHFGDQEATERYLRGRSDGLRLPAHFHMIWRADRRSQRSGPSSVSWP